MRKSTLILFILLGTLLTASSQVFPRTDTLFIQKVNVLPVIDGDAGDQAWAGAAWNPIDQIWMPWGNNTANLSQATGLQLWSGPDDFAGRFKVVWSDQTNLLYFLVEINDDVFVDGYVYHENPNNGGSYPN